VNLPGADDESLMGTSPGTLISIPSTSDTEVTYRRDYYFQHQRVVRGRAPLSQRPLRR
jgi:hypothetical protein